MSIVRKGRLVELKGGRKVWVMPLLARDQESLVAAAVDHGSVVQMRLMNLAVCAAITGHEGLMANRANPETGEVEKVAFPAEPVMEKSAALGRKVMPRSILDALSYEDRGEIMHAAWHNEDGVTEEVEGKSDASPNS